MDMSIAPRASDSSLQYENNSSQHNVNFLQESHTAEEFITSQLQLEADALEALPYQFDTCTQPLGPLRQLVFSCLTCNPPLIDSLQPYNAAGLCYSCSISCHGEHNLVELFNKRKFVCDCGTTRLPSTSPCSLRLYPDTGTKGGVHSQQPAGGNRYNQNFSNRFCGCRQGYDVHTEKGTMFQCLGLGRVDDGGCDEDWWHPECLVGVDREWYKQGKPAQTVEQMHNSNGDQDISTSGIAPANGEVGDINSGTEQADLKTRGEPTLDEEEPPMPPGFPKEDDFEHMICYKCVNAFPWIKRYAGSPGFLNAPRHNNGMPAAAVAEPADVVIESNAICVSHDTQVDREDVSKKRKAEEDEQDEHTSCRSFKKPRAEHDPEETLQQPVSPHCRYATLPTAPSEPVSLFLKPDFREYLCHCPTCFPLLAVHPQLLEEEENYEPPRSSSSAATSHNGDAGGRSNSIGSRSLLDRGEAALSNMDRVRAIEGVMAYNHVRDKVKDFLKPFAESGQAVGAEDIKSYFEKLRGDDRAIKEARNSGSRRGRDDDQEGDARREQRGC